MDLILSNIFSGLGGGLIVFMINLWINRKPVKDFRNLAIKALQLFKKYEKVKEYQMSANEFNVTFLNSDKRCIFVVLHKVGIPFNLDIAKFDIDRISFNPKIIRLDELNDMIKQVENGSMDPFFNKDVDAYVQEVYSMNEFINQVKISRIL